MVEAGILHEHERFELIGGEIVPMAAKGPIHESLKSTLNLCWAQRLPSGIVFATETTFRLDREPFVEPDFVLREGGRHQGTGARNRAAGGGGGRLEPGVGLGVKARIYASFGVREVWVINACSLATRVHAEPGPKGYASKRTIRPNRPNRPIVPQFAPELAVKLAELEPM